MRRAGEGRGGLEAGAGDGSRASPGMLEDEHPRGSGPLVGCQLRCGFRAWLAGGCGVRGLGRTGLSAATDGWDDAGRRAHLHRVASLCRARGVVPPLARSGPRGPCGRKRLRRTLRLPLLETFEDRHAGTSFQAANWAGETAGRGRQGHAATETLKAVTNWMRAGESAFRNRLRRLRRWKSALVWDRESWAEQEFRRRAAGGCASERAPGDLRPPPGRRCGRSQALRGEIGP